MDKLHEEIKGLAGVRQTEAEIKAEVADIQAELEASALWKALQERKALLRSASEAAEQQADYVRELALAAYGKRGDKRVHPAVTIKTYTTLNYDPANALNYAREHLPGALKLDVRAFEKVAKVAGLDFVEIEQEPRATIARDMSKYLDEQPA